MNNSRSFVGSVSRAWRWGVYPVDAPALAFLNAFRSLRRRPAFFVIATISLSLALGICGVMFSLIEAMRHPVVPYDDPSRIAIINQAGNAAYARDEFDAHNAALADLREIEALTTTQPSIIANVVVGESSSRHSVARVDRGFFDVIRVSTQSGRLFSRADNSEDNVAVVNGTFWLRELKGHGAVGTVTIDINGELYRVIGVVSAAVKLPDNDVAIWVPARVPTEMRSDNIVVARLRNGVTLARLKTVLHQVAARFNGAAAPTASFQFVAGTAEKSPPEGGPALMMLVFAACIAGIACANIGALTLANTIARRRDLAVRLALGARIRALVADQLCEVAIVALCAAVLGTAVGTWAASLFAQGQPSQFVGPGASFEPRLTWRVMLSMLGAAVAIMAAITLIASRGIARVNPADPIKDNAATTTGRSRGELQRLVFAQLTLTMALLALAGLFLRSAERVDQFDYGYDPARLRRISGILIPAGDTMSFPAGVESMLLSRIREVPGVFGATQIGHFFPQMSSLRRANDDSTPITFVTRVDAGANILSVLRIPMLAGRDFEQGDITAGDAAIIDARMARILFGGEDAIGKYLYVDKAKLVRVVGVARAAELDWPDDRHASNGFVLVAARARSSRLWNLVARLDPQHPTVVQELQRVVRQTLPARSIAEISTFAKNGETGRVATRFLMYVFGVLAGSGLLLAAVGVLGVVSYSVNQRMREFGVRIALGAQTVAIARLVLMGAVRTLIPAIVVGGTMGVWFGYLMRVAIYDVPTLDAVSLARAVGVLVVVTLAACVAPALRATRVNPAEVMRAN